MARLSVALTYADRVTAARWLHDAFGLTSWDGIPARGESRDWVELHVGNVAVLLFAPSDQPGTEGDGLAAPAAGKLESGHLARHRLWVYVEDVDAHLDHAQAAGAAIVSGMYEHGYRGYTAADLDGHLWTFVQDGPWVAPQTP